MPAWLVQNELPSRKNGLCVVGVPPLNSKRRRALNKVKKSMAAAINYSHCYCTCSRSGTGRTTKRYPRFSRSTESSRTHCSALQVNKRASQHSKHALPPSCFCLVILHRAQDLLGLIFESPLESVLGRIPVCPCQLHLLVAASFQ